MKAAAFDYVAAGSLAQAIDLQRGGGAQLMGGSQSLGPMLNLRLARPARVLDISRVPELCTVEGRGEWIEIGAAVTHAMIEDGVHAALKGHPMQQVAAGIAYRSIRVRGTLGGSLAHADPAADWVVVMPALNARVVLASARGTREVAASDFMIGAYTTVKEPDEVITSVKVPRLSPSARWGYHKLCRKPGEFADASAAIRFEAERGEATVVLGAVERAPVRLEGLARRLLTEPDVDPTRADLTEAVKQALPDRDRIDVQRYAICLERALGHAGIRVRSPAAGASR